MHVLLLGGSGQVGLALQQSAAAGMVINAPASSALNLTDKSALRQLLHESKPDAVINCAAFTRVDDAEKEVDVAHALNAVAPDLLARECATLGARFVHVSTDYVFNGNAGAPYGTDAAVQPLSVYGQSKLQGEQLVLSANPNATVVRTAWVHSGAGVNFVATAVGLFLRGKVMHVVDDQISTPTRALHLAQALWAVVARPEIRGLHHFTDAGVASWYDVAQCVLDTLQRDGMREPGTAVVPVPTTAFPRPARRPRVSVLDKHATWEALKITPQHWRVGVAASTRELANA